MNVCFKIFSGLNQVGQCGRGGGGGGGRKGRNAQDEQLWPSLLMKSVGARVKCGPNTTAVVCANSATTM